MSAIFLKFAQIVSRKYIIEIDLVGSESLFEIGDGAAFDLYSFAFEVDGFDHV